MIYAPLSSYSRSKDFPLAAAATLAADGQALVSAFTSSVFGVSPSANTSGEKFIGFLNAQTSAIPFLPTTATKVENLTVPVGGLMTVAQTPVAGTTMVFDVTTGLVIASPTVSGKTVQVTATTYDGHSVIVTYRYSLTVAAAQALAGSVQPGGFSGNVIGSVPVVQAGTVYTDQFNTAVDWRAATSVKTFTGGFLTDQTGTGATLSCTIVALPTTDIPFLGIEFNTY